MTGRPTDALTAAIDDLTGQWRCFEGDGIHGWDDRDIQVVGTADALSITETVLTSNGATRQFGPFAAHVSLTSRGIRLVLDDEERSVWDIRPNGGTLTLWRSYVDVIVAPKSYGFRRVRATADPAPLRNP